MRRLTTFWRDRDGAAAVEMAMILPGVLFLMVGGGFLALLTYATTCLHSATEAATRYASTQYAAGNTPTCTSPAGANDVCAVALKMYKGPTLTGLTFTYSTTGTCSTNSSGNTGLQVSATGSYNLWFGVGRKAVTLNTQSCFPKQS